MVGLGDARPPLITIPQSPVQGEKAVKEFLKRSRTFEEQTLHRRPVQYLVDRILPAVGFFLVAGDPKLAAKSLLTLHLAKCVITGRPFLGHAVQRGNVFAANFEDGDGRIGDRLYRMGYRADARMSPDKRGRTITSPEDLALMLEAVRYGRPSLVILDPMISVELAFGLTDENNPAAVTALTQYLHQLSEDTPTAILGCSHFRKQGDTVRGSTAWNAGVDGWWNLYPGEGETRRLEATLRDGPATSEAYELIHPKRSDGVIRVKKMSLEDFVPAAGRGFFRGGKGGKRQARLTDEALHLKVCEMLIKYTCDLSQNGEGVSVNAIHGRVGGQRQRIIAKLADLKLDGLVEQTDSAGGYRWIGPM